MLIKAKWWISDSKSEDKIKLNFTEQQLLSLYLTLIESQSYSTLPYTNEIQSIINQIINIPNTRVRKSLNQMTNLIKFEDTEQNNITPFICRHFNL